MFEVINKNTNEIYTVYNMKIIGYDTMFFVFDRESKEWKWILPSETLPYTATY